MDVCLMIEGQEGVTWDQSVALALACEEHGFQGLFRSDHYLSFGRPAERGSLDAWATLAALGARTQRIQLGTMVSPVTFRHPSELVKAVVVADHASGGRIAVGMGAGWFEGEHRAYGFPFPPLAQRMEMLEEQVEIVHRSLSHDETVVDFEGRHYRLENCPAIPKPVQRPHPPLIIGGDAGPRSTRLAARWADEYNVNFVGPEECRKARAVLDDACTARSRDSGELRLSLMTGSLVGEDRGALERRAGALMERRGQSGDAVAYLDGLDAAWITGTPDQVLDRLRALAEAGVHRILLQHLLHEDLEAVALIGSEIIPEAASL
jgi:F420-dependent oxidoreductase-like protein